MTIACFGVLEFTKRKIFVGPCCNINPTINIKAIETTLKVKKFRESKRTYLHWLV